MKSYELPSGLAGVDLVRDEKCFTLPLLRKNKKLALEEALTHLADLTHQHYAALELIDTQRTALEVQRRDIVGLEALVRRKHVLINNLTSMAQEKNDESNN